MEFLYDFSKIFPNKKIKMVRILSSESIVDKQEFVLSDKISLVQYRFDDFIGGEWIGNYEKWMEVMSNYTLSI